MACWLLNIWLRIQDTEDGGVTLLRNAGNYLSVEMASHPRRPESFLFMFSTKISYSSHFAKACDLAQVSKYFWIHYAVPFSFIHSFFILFDFSCTLLPLFPLPFFHSACFFSCLSLPTSRLSCYLYFFPSVNLSLFSSDLLFCFDAVDPLTWYVAVGTTKNCHGAEKVQGFTGWYIITAHFETWLAFRSVWCEWIRSIYPRSSYMYILLEQKGGVQVSRVLFYSKRYENNSPALLLWMSDTAVVNSCLEIRNPWRGVPLSVRLNKCAFISYIIYATLWTSWRKFPLAFQGLHY
jgi:hypothetical protein